MKMKEEFIKIYNEHIATCVKKFLEKEENSEPIMYTLDAGVNKFRSGLSYIISNSVSNPYGITIGAISEIIWASILILDDLGDNTEIRRGNPAVWKRNGILHACHIFSLAQCICEDIINETIHDDKIQKSFRKAIKDTIDSQIEQVYFKIDNLCREDFKSNYRKKTSIGRWALVSSSYTNPKFAEEINRCYEDISFAGQLKDDVEDFIKDDSYEKSLEDLKQKVVTFPLYMLFEISDASEKNIIYNYFHTDDEIDIQLILKMLKKYDIINRCKNIINTEVDTVLNSMSYDLKTCIPEFYNWLQAHKI